MKIHEVFQINEDLPTAPNNAGPAPVGIGAKLKNAAKRVGQGVATTAKVSAALGRRAASNWQTGQTRLDLHNGLTQGLRRGAEAVTDVSRNGQRSNQEIAAIWNRNKPASTKIVPASNGSLPLTPKV